MSFQLNHYVVLPVTLIPAAKNYVQNNFGFNIQNLVCNVDRWRFWFLKPNAEWGLYCGFEFEKSNVNATPAKMQNLKLLLESNGGRVLPASSDFQQLLISNWGDAEFYNVTNNQTNWDELEIGGMFDANYNTIDRQP